MDLEQINYTLTAENNSIGYFSIKDDPLCQKSCQFHALVLGLIFARHLIPQSIIYSLCGTKFMGLFT